MAPVEVPGLVCQLDSMDKCLSRPIKTVTPTIFYSVGRAVVL